MLYSGECRVQAEVAAGSGAEHNEGWCIDQRQEEPEQARLARVRFEVIHGEVDFIDHARIPFVEKDAGPCDADLRVGAAIVSICEVELGAVGDIVGISDHAGRKPGDHILRVPAGARFIMTVYCGFIVVFHGEFDVYVRMPPRLRTGWGTGIGQQEEVMELFFRRLSGAHGQCPPWRPRTPPPRQVPGDEGRGTCCRSSSTAVPLLPLGVAAALAVVLSPVL